MGMSGWPEEDVDADVNDEKEGENEGGNAGFIRAHMSSMSSKACWRLSSVRDFDVGSPSRLRERPDALRPVTL